jgi:nicotinamidase-related amidase
MNQTALILIEAQNEWLAEDGKLRKLIKDKDAFQQSIKKLEKVLRKAREIPLPIVHVGLRFQEGYPELANGRSGLRAAIPIAGTFPAEGKGSEFYPSLSPVEGEFVVSGRTGASAFSGSNLDVYLRNNHIENLLLTGYATHVCVESTLREAHDRGYNSMLIEDACAAFTTEQQQYVLKHIVHHFGTAISSEAFLAGKNILQYAHA